MMPTTIAFKLVPRYLTSGEGTGQHGNRRVLVSNNVCNSPLEGAALPLMAQLKAKNNATENNISDTGNSKHYFLRKRPASISLDIEKATPRCNDPTMQYCDRHPQTTTPLFPTTTILSVLKQNTPNLENG